jgi:hypothetical protein
MSAHTPGPWRVERRGSRQKDSTVYRWIKGSRLIGDDDKPVVAFLHVGRFGGRTMEKVDANAAMIAAAPEMYAVLSDVRDFLHSHGYDTRMVDYAIDKAEGREP